MNSYRFRTTEVEWKFSKVLVCVLIQILNEHSQTRSIILNLFFKKQLIKPGRSIKTIAIDGEILSQVIILVSLVLIERRFDSNFKLKIDFQNLMY